MLAGSNGEVTYVFLFHQGNVKMLGDINQTEAEAEEITSRCSGDVGTTP